MQMRLKINTIKYNFSKLNGLSMEWFKVLSTGSLQALRYDKKISVSTFVALITPFP